MPRVLSTIIAVTALVLSANGSVKPATASDFGGCDACYPGDFPPYWVPRVHKFRPRPADGVPFVSNRRLYPDGYHGVGCLWTRRVMATPHGKVKVLVPDCVSY